MIHLATPTKYPSLFSYNNDVLPKLPLDTERMHPIQWSKLNSFFLNYALKELMRLKAISAMGYVRKNRKSEMRQ
jgi:hypothetical protein